MSSSCVCTLHSCPAQLIWGQIQLSSATGVRPGRDLATRGAFTRKLNRWPRSSTSSRSEKRVAGLFPRRLLVAGGTCAHTGSPGETQDWWWVRPAWLSWAREPGRSAATDGASDRHAEILLAEHLDTGDTEELMEYLECGPEGIPSNQQLVRMGDNNNTQSIADYLAQLLKDKKQLAAFPNVFIHMERLLDDGEYSRDCL